MCGRRIGKITTAGALDEALGLVFAGTSEPHLLFAVNITSGATVWEYDAGERGQTWGTLGPLDATAGTLALALVVHPNTH